MKRSILLWGGTGQAKVLAEFLPAIGFEVVAVGDSNPAVPSPLLGVPLLAGWDIFLTWRDSHPGPCYFLVTIGGDKGAVRLEMQGRLAEHGLEPAVAVHPTAYVACNARLGLGTQVLINASVGAEAVLGAGCIVNTASSIDHECVLADGVHVGPGATLAGCVSVGEAAFIGAGAVVLPRLKVGPAAVVGAGAVVTRDVPPGAVVTGVPARFRRSI